MFKYSELFLEVKPFIILSLILQFFFFFSYAKFRESYLRLKIHVELIYVSEIFFFESHHVSPPPPPPASTVQADPLKGWFIGPTQEMLNCIVGSRDPVG